MLNDVEVLPLVDRVIGDYKGDARELEKAIGMLVLGRRLGWKPLLLVHDKKTVRKYEGILGLSVRDALPDLGDLAHKSVALKVVKAVGNFWAGVRGGIKGARTPDID